MSLLDAANAFFTALATASSPRCSPSPSRPSTPGSSASMDTTTPRICTSTNILPYFSTTSPVFVQHVHTSNPHPQSSRLYGLNAVRSYFDLLDTHWIRVRTSLRKESTSSSSSSTSDPAATSAQPSGSSGSDSASSPDSTPSLSDLMEVDEEAPSTTTTTTTTTTIADAASTPTSTSPFRINPTQLSVTLDASTTWKWRKSGRTWVEDFTLTIHFDEALKVTRFIVVTVSPLETCVLRAVDVDPSDMFLKPGFDVTMGGTGGSGVQRTSRRRAGTERDRLVVGSAAGSKGRRATASGALGAGWNPDSVPLVSGGGLGGDSGRNESSREWMHTRGPGAVFLV